MRLRCFRPATWALGKELDGSEALICATVDAHGCFARELPA